MTSDSCAGSCCAVFTLKTPVAEHYGDYIVDMAIPLTDAQAIERRERFGGDPWMPGSEDSDRKPFTCRHWDEETRLCGAYEDRPKMCRDFPYYGKCPNGSCGYCAPPEVVEEWRQYRRNGVGTHVLQPRGMTK